MKHKGRVSRGEGTRPSFLFYPNSSKEFRLDPLDKKRGKPLFLLQYFDKQLFFGGGSRGTQKRPQREGVALAGRDTGSAAQADFPIYEQLSLLIFLRPLR